MRIGAGVSGTETPSLLTLQVCQELCLGERRVCLCDLVKTQESSDVERELPAEVSYPA